MKNVILVYPKTGIDPVKPHPPHSLLSLASPLEKEGYKPIIMDERVDDYKKKIQANIKDSICVGISTMTGFQISHALQIAKFIKSLDKNKILIWGGVHSTFLPEQTIQNPNVDIIIKGEGELILPQILKAIEKKESFNKIPNITFKKNNKIISTKGIKLIDLDLIPKTPWHLIDIEKYIRSDFGVERTICLLTSRGCTSKCAFCYNLNFNYGKWRGKSAKKIVDEIEYLHKNYSINGFHFIDDQFFCSKKRVEEYCKELIKRKINIKWNTNCRIDYFASYDEDFIKLLKQSGLAKLDFGVESGSPRILKLINKEITLDQVYKTVLKCKKYNIQSQFSFIVGFPTETKDDIKQTLKCINTIHKLDPIANVSGLFAYTTYPGTPLYPLSLKYGFKSPKNLEEWRQYTFYTATSKMGWLTKKDLNYINTITYLVRFVFYDKTVKKSFSNPLIKLGFNILHYTGKIRWKYQAFKFPIEWKILNLYYKRSSLR